MNARIDAVRVAATEEGPVPVVILAVEDSDAPRASDRSSGLSPRDSDEPRGEGDDATTEAAGSDDVLPIFIGFDEAISIARGLEAVDDIGRPLTHDLLLDVIEELGGRVESVEISAVENNTYIAELSLNTPRDDVVIDARPSDSLALAARTNAPLSVSREVYEEGRHPRSEFENLQHIREVVARGPGDQP